MGKPERIGSPLQNQEPNLATDPELPGLPATPGGTQDPKANDYARAAMGLGLGEVASKFEDQPVPGYPSLSVGAFQKRWFRASVAQTIKIQRKLVAAGYLPKDKIQTMGDPFDHATFTAMNWLLEDAVTAGYSPNDVLGYRMAIKAGQKPGSIAQMASAEYADPKQWEREMADEYVATWRSNMPEGYLKDKQHMNPTELGAYERAKATWQQSDVAKDDEKELGASLARYFNQPRQNPDPEWTGRVTN